MIEVTKEKFFEKLHEREKLGADIMPRIVKHDFPIIPNGETREQEKSLEKQKTISPNRQDLLRQNIL